MIEIYIRAFCPYCDKVINAARQLGLTEGKEYKTIDAAVNTPGREKLLRLGGKTMVPFLVDGQTHMYESLDIISYLKTKQS
jgi:glutaredoxin